MTGDTLTFRSLTGRFVLSATGMHFRGSTHDVASVSHLERYASRTISMVAPWSGHLSSLKIRIHFKTSARPITLTNRFAFSSGASRLQALFEQLSQITFQQRVAQYLMQLEREGVFKYGGATFMRSGEVRAGAKAITLRDAKVSWEPFSLTVKEPAGIFKKKIRVNTTVDQDVLFSLLQQLYGITL